MSLQRVQTHYFTAGLVVENDIVVEAAPILDWAIGKHLPVVKAWAETKGGSVKEVGGP